VKERSSDSYANKNIEDNTIDQDIKNIYKTLFDHIKKQSEIYNNNNNNNNNHDNHNA